MAPSDSSHAKPSDKAEWLLLKSVENVILRKNVLGAVVPKSSQYDPFDNYSPHWDDPSLDNEMTVGTDRLTKKTVLRNMVNKLWIPNSAGEDTAVQLNDILTGKIAAKTRTMQGAITELFNVFLKKSEVEEVSIESGSVKRYRIDNPGGKLRDNLVPCTPWKEQLQKLYDSTAQRKSPFMLVTGIMVCESLKIRWKRDANSNTEAGAKVSGNAVLAAFGQAPNPELAKYLDSKFEFDQERSTSENVFATCNHDVILSIRYNYLNLTFEKNPDAKEPIWPIRLVTKSTKAGTIKGANLGEVVLGTGIMSYASAASKQNNESEELEEHQEKEEEGVDWFYSGPAPDVDNETHEQNDEPAGPRGTKV